MIKIVRFLYRPFCKKRWDIFENIIRSIEKEPLSWEEKYVDSYKPSKGKYIEFYKSYSSTYRVMIGKNYTKTFFSRCNLINPVKLKMPLPLRIKYCKVASRYMESNNKKTKKRYEIDNALEKSKELYKNPANKRDSKIDDVLDEKR